MVGAPFKPYFGLSGIPALDRQLFQVHDDLHRAQSAIEVRGIPLKPKYDLNGAPTIC
jgi:hypothetical protein